MLNVTNLSGSGASLTSYFEKESGQKDYWQKEAQSATCWHGRGAEALGLSGAVNQEAFEKIMDGILPDGTQMPGGQGGERRMGYDLTFSAPKSVSLEGLVVGDKRVIEAHDQAVAKALDWIEKEAAQTQIKTNGVIDIAKTDNITAAVFRHETSRELDPQLHSHAVVSNFTRDANGKYRALDNSEIYKLRMTAGAIYRSELAHGLQQVGHSVHQTTADGRFEIDGYSKAQLDEFSTRRKRIEAELAERGLSGAEASQQAALMTRQAKITLTDEGKAAMQAEWRERAEKLGIHISPDSRGGDSVKSNPEQVQREADKAVQFAVEHLSERSSTFPEYRLREAAMQRAVGSARIGDIQPAIDRAIESRGLLEIETESGTRFATSDSLLRERQTIAIMDRGHGIAPAVADQSKINLATERLNQGQAASARLILTSHDRVTGVQGFAGTGKTYMLSRVADVAVAEGYAVIAIAPTADAAKTLGTEIGTEGQTLASHLLDRSQADEKPGKQLWIVDEAGLASSKDMQRLLAKSEREDAKVILVGDTKQLRGVEAGQPFKSLQEHGMQTSEMSEVMRHKSADLATTVDLIRQGKGQEAIAAMREGSGAKLEWVQPPKAHDGKEPTWEEKRQARLLSAVDKYMSARTHGDSLLVAERRDDRAQLNNMVRDRLIERGEIKAQGAQATALIAKDMTRPEARMAHAYSAGDIVEFGRNYKSLGIEKGQRLAVHEIDYKQGLVKFDRGDGQSVAWNPAKLTKAQAYTEEKKEIAQGDKIAWTKNDHAHDRRNGQLADVIAVDRQSQTATVRLQNGQEQRIDLGESQHLDHAHATTIYKSQGRTVDHVIIASNTRSREGAYVAISRARHSSDMVVNSPDGQAKAIEREPENDNVLDYFKDHKEQQQTPDHEVPENNNNQKHDHEHEGLSL
jgi:conjugative relaxase-like TrwC/TraI family protein